MRLSIVFGCLLIGASLHAGQQQPECLHDDACQLGECKVWESSRFVCEPQTYAVMVYPSKCLIKDTITPQSYMEMRMDGEGKPDRKTARLVGTEIVFKPDCGHIEIRKRNVNY